METYGFGWYLPKSLAIGWPTLYDLIREAFRQSRPVRAIAALSIAPARLPVRPFSTGHESRQRHRGLGGRKFR